MRAHSPPLQRASVRFILVLVFVCIELSHSWSAGGFPKRAYLWSSSRQQSNDHRYSPKSVEAVYRYAIHASQVDGSYDMEDDDDEEELSDEELAATTGEWDERIACFNTIHLTGRVGNAPEAKYFDDGKVVVNLSLATRRKHHVIERKLFNIKSGEEATDWYGLEIWGQTAEFVSKYVDKGARIGVIGQLQVDSWTDKATGELRNRAKVVVRDLDILETRVEAELRRGGNGRQNPSFDDDDIDGPVKAGSGGFFDN